MASVVCFRKQPMPDTDEHSEVVKITTDNRVETSESHLIKTTDVSSEHEIKETLWFQMV